VGRHTNGDTPTGVLFVAPPDPTFRRAAGGNRKTGKIPKIKPPAAQTATLPAAAAHSAPQRPPAPAIPAPRRSPEQAAPMAAPLPAQREPIRSAPALAARGHDPVRPPLSLPMWTKVCVVLGAVLLLVGFGGLGAAYAVNQQADPRSAGSELIQR
jgi:hypothetical protein